ncbi:hypothetical protein C8P68_102521 [Mucilaginibacter yixingensis]|uniref:Uncharacterized protein n=1 Tax=Mucilaginibacter yixingensis TaxID=1295612 RepID=A0A2T5JD57_9SPHI|nr:hypothetical protein [Mucilaginibacter yixingensis]PTQ99693.1 hypothetical protein C8P68_102521 [Mucilaginibacter yixingensis]
MALVLIFLVFLIIVGCFILIARVSISRPRDKAQIQNGIAAIGEVICIENTFVEYGTGLDARRVLNILLKIIDEGGGTREVNVEQAYRYWSTPQEGEKFNILIDVNNPDKIVILEKIEE